MTKLSGSQREQRAQAKIERQQAKNNYSRLVRLGYSDFEAKTLTATTVTLANGAVVPRKQMDFTLPSMKRMIATRARARQRSDKKGIPLQIFLKNHAKTDVSDLWKRVHVYEKHFHGKDIEVRKKAIEKAVKEAIEKANKAGKPLDVKQIKDLRDELEGSLAGFGKSRPKTPLTDEQIEAGQKKSHKKLSQQRPGNVDIVKVFNRKTGKTENVETIVINGRHTYTRPMTFVNKRWEFD